MGALGTAHCHLWSAGDTSVGGYRRSEHRRDDGGGGDSGRSEHVYQFLQHRLDRRRTYQGVSYFRQRPPNPVGGIFMHPALYPGHAFFSDQNGIGSGTCTAADVIVLRNETRRHEGVGLFRNSHVGVTDSLFAQYRPDSTIFELAALRQSKFNFVEAAYNRYVSWVTAPSPWMVRQSAFDLVDGPIVNGSISFTLDFNLNDAG